jgi:hypothetical protein
VLRIISWQVILPISAAVVLFHPLLDLSFIPRNGIGLPASLHK